MFEYTHIWVNKKTAVKFEHRRFYVLQVLKKYTFGNVNVYFILRGKWLEIIFQFYI